MSMVSGAGTGTTAGRGRSSSRRPAFTLVEMLTVIVIISILAALIVPAVLNAVRTARNGTIRMEVANLQQALERYATTMGEYPPDFSQPTPELKQAAINAHLSRTYRFRNLRALYNDQQNPGDLLTQQDLEALNPTNALWFWLRGFSPDPQRPLTGAGDRTPWYNFADSQVRVDPLSPFAVYYAPSADRQQTPYIYYRANTAQKNLEYQMADVWSYGPDGTEPRILPMPNGNTVTAPRPYFARESNQVPVTYASRDKFQIICAGLDGNYGFGGQSQNPPPVSLDPSDPLNPLKAISGIFPLGPYSSPERDNICSFGEEATLEDNQP